VTPGRTLALAAALAAVAVATGCSPAPAVSSAGAASAQRGASPAITAPAAREVFDRYAAAAGKATAPESASALLALVTGVERAALTAALARHSVVRSGAQAPSGAYGSVLTVRPGFDAYGYGPPTFYLPEAAGYPRFFVASVTRTLRGTAGATSTATTVGDARLPQDGPVLMLFSQDRKGASWLLASIARLPAGMTVPPLARDASGYIPTMTPSAAALLAQPADVGPLQAAVVDEGPAAAAATAVAAGPLTTGMYQGAASHAGGMTAPRGDVYQWELDGGNYPVFGLRTAAGGALVFYGMTLNTTVAVPDVIDKADPVRPGPPIQVPLDLRMLLPENQHAPLVQLQSRQTLSFAAVDPPKGTAKVQVIAIGGGLTSASAS
jgi:hypothetical protein